MSASGPIMTTHGQERLEELSGTVFDLAGKIAPRVSLDEVEARLRRTLQEASHYPGRNASREGSSAIPDRQGASPGQGIY